MYVTETKYFRVILYTLKFLYIYIWKYIAVFQILGLRSAVSRRLETPVLWHHCKKKKLFGTLIFISEQLL